MPIVSEEIIDAKVVDLKVTCENITGNKTAEMKTTFVKIAGAKSADLKKPSVKVLCRKHQVKIILQVEVSTRTLVWIRWRWCTAEAAGRL